jgi:uncharacterized damage-inducible protein DinB
MRTTLLLTAAVLVGIPSPARAQTTDSSPDVALSVSHAEIARAMHASIRRNLQEAAEAMPDDGYAFKPTPEVRTFAQLLAHVINANNAFCEQAGGGQRPPGDGRDVSQKAALVEVLRAALAFCDRVYEGTTDANYSAPVTVAANGRSTPTTRGGLLTFNTAHNNEHYGNLVIYLRLKGIVPPSTARANQQ